MRGAMLTNKSSSTSNVATAIQTTTTSFQSTPPQQNTETKLTGGTNRGSAIEILDEDFDLIITSEKATLKRGLEDDNQTQSNKRGKENPQKDSDGNIPLS